MAGHAFNGESSNGRIAIAAIVASVFALSLGDAVIKSTGTSLPLWQMYILRSLLVLPALIIIQAKLGRSARVTALGWVVVRSLVLVLMWLCYYSSLSYMPLSLAAAAYYTAPLFITILVAVVSGKLPGGRIWLAVVMGFGGVLLILQPETAAFQWVTLLPVFAAFLYAVAMMITSTKCSLSDPVDLAVALNVAFVVSGVVLGFWGGASNQLSGSWVPLTMELAGVIVLLAIAILIGSVGAAIAYQKGPPATIAAFDYSYLVFSLLWGVLFFTEFPGWVAMLGIVAIAIAGLLAVTQRTS